MKKPQFSDTEREQVIELVEVLPWADLVQHIRGLEAALSLALEALASYVKLWETEGEERFEDEFLLSAKQVGKLDDEWRLAYVARLLQTAAIAYGVSPGPTPGRNSEGEVTPPAGWEAFPGSIAQLLRGLHDIVYGMSPPTNWGDTGLGTTP